MADLTTQERYSLGELYHRALALEDQIEGWRAAKDHGAVGEELAALYGAAMGLTGAVRHALGDPEEVLPESEFPDLAPAACARCGHPIPSKT